MAIESYKRNPRTNKRAKKKRDEMSNVPRKMRADRTRDEKKYDLV